MNQYAGIAIGWLGYRTIAYRRVIIVALIINWLIAGNSAFLATVAGYRVYWGDWSALARVWLNGGFLVVPGCLMSNCPRNWFRASVIFAREMIGVS